MSRAVALAEHLLGEHKNNIPKLVLIPSSNGVFEISIGDELIFSKKELDRFPKENEVEGLVREKLD